MIFLWSCSCRNWRSLRSKIENLDQCRNESVSFEYTKRFAPNMYRSYLSQYSRQWNLSTKPEVHISNSVVIWFWWFSQQGSAQSDPEPQFLGTTLPLSSSHEFAHTPCGHAAKGLDGQDEPNHGDNGGGEDVEEFCELYCLSRMIKRKNLSSFKPHKSLAFLSPEVPWPLRLFEQQRLWVFQWLAWYPHSCSRLLHTQGW